MTLKQAFKFLLLIVLFAPLQNKSFAGGGFPVRPGRLVISATASYFFANKGWDSLGVKRPFANNGRYTSEGLILSGEYGISKRFAVVATVPFVNNHYRNDNFSTNSAGLTDIETGLKYYLANIDYIYYFSVQGTAITPLYTNRSLGYGQEGGELKLAFSGSGYIGEHSIYFNVENGVRQYFGTDGPIQDRYSGTFGYTLDKEFYNQISVTLSGIWSQSNNKAFSPIQETNKDFSFKQISLSYGHSFTRETSLFLTAGKFIAGRNTGDGLTASLAFIYRLDYR